MGAFLCVWAGPVGSILGAIGSFLLAVPYFYDLSLRRDRVKAKKLPDGELKDEFIKVWTEFVLSPAGGLVGYVAIGGALLLVISFIMVFFQSISCEQSLVYQQIPSRIL